MTDELRRKDTGPIEAKREPPVVARLVVEIRSDGSHTIARGAAEDMSTGERVSIEAEGATRLEQAANQVFLHDGDGVGPALRFQGVAVVAGQFGAWTPVAAEQTADGYRVAWKLGAAGQFIVSDLVWIFVAQSASYASGAVSWIFAEQAGYRAFGRYVLHFSRVTRYETRLLNDRTMREQVEPFLAEMREMFNSPRAMGNLEKLVISDPNAKEHLAMLRERFKQMAAMRAEAASKAQAG